MPEPALIDEPTPILPDRITIESVPEVRPPIPVENRTAAENVKPASGSIWNLFRPSRKRPTKTPAKPREDEPSFLDGLDEFEDSIDLPRCLVDPRR